MGIIHYYHADGSYDSARAEKHPPIEAIQHFVGGDAERVWVLFNGTRCAMFVNENGHQLKLQINPRATDIYHEAAKKRGLANPYPILGDAIVLEDIPSE